MSVKKRDQGGNEGVANASRGGSAGAASGEAVKRQKALAASERARRKEREQGREAGGREAEGQEAGGQEAEGGEAEGREEAGEAQAAAETQATRRRRQARGRWGAGLRHRRAQGRRWHRERSASSSSSSGARCSSSRSSSGSALAEIIGKFVLAVWLPRRHCLLLRTLGRFARPSCTSPSATSPPPARSLSVGLVAIGALVAAQWLDYSAVSVGVDAYSGDGRRGRAAARGRRALRPMTRTAG